MLKNIYKILLVFLVILLPSCLEEVVNAPGSYSNSSDLITYIETRTNFFTGDDKPLLVTVDELNQNINDYLILDIREALDFEMGHIQNSVNVEMKNLLNYLKGNNTLLYEKIVIVSSTGQLASYSSSLLCIAGYDNVYTLDRGMTYWNQIFSDELRNAQGNAVKWVKYQESIKPTSISSPPDVLYQNAPKTIEEKIEERLQLMLNKSQFDIFISADEFENVYSVSNFFLIYSIPDSILHEAVPIGPSYPPRKIMGPMGVTEYDTPWDFISENYLLTIPVDKETILYSPNGQRSAYYTAYLNILGYQATTVKYGSISMMRKLFDPIYVTFYYDPRTGEPIVIYRIPYIAPYGFDEKQIRDYHFEVGK